MAIKCPWCARPIDLKGARPGRFTPRCPFCGRKFSLHIPADGSAPQAQKPAVPRQAEVATMPPLDPAGMGVNVATDIPPAGDTGAKPAAAGVAVVAASSGSSASSPTAAPSPVAAAAPVAAEGNGDGQLPGSTLGGYRILHKLGQGGMGAVYRAIQLSLNRDVAVKVLLRRLAEDAQFVARFVREAYAAAQISHHHMVQIHDIGAERRTHFFSMEFVDGQTLAALVREQGRLAPDVAVGYVLQAARGLKVAHDHGLVHRDVKPDNLLLSSIGIVKVTDLGIVKTLEPQRRSEREAAKRAVETGRWYDDETQLNISMGTPAYMAPEQALDAASVDARADIYALGCTLYALLVGHPPFPGGNATEVIHRHLHDQPVPPEQIVDDVLPSLSRIVLKMMAKRREDRYADMGEVIDALEQYLNLPADQPFAPKAEQVKAVQSCLQWFNSASWAGVRAKLILGFFVLCALLLPVSLLLPVAPQVKMMLIGAVIGYAVLTPAAYIVISGITQRTYLFMKIRELIWDGGIREWLMILSAAIVGIAGVVAMGWHWPWLLAAAAAVGTAAAFHYAVDPRVAAQRSQPLAHVQSLLAALRRQGVAEPALRQFICQQGGERWEEFFEALFGYEAKMQARRRWGRVGEADAGPARRGANARRGDPGRARLRHAAWRDPIIQWIDQVLQVRRLNRERRFIESVEQRSLEAGGMLQSLARRRAQSVAAQMVAHGARLREQTAEQSLEITKRKPPPHAAAEAADQPRPETPESPETKAPDRTITPKALNYTEGLENWEHLSYFQRRYGSVWNLVFGPAVRFVAGCALLLACIVWLRQSGMLPQWLGGDADAAADVWSHLVGTLSPPVVFNIAACGMLLVISAFSGRPTLGMWLLPAVLIALAGGAYLPDEAGLNPHTLALIAAALVAALGLTVTRAP